VEALCHENIGWVAAGHDFTLALSHDRLRLFSIGVNDCGQLGIGCGLQEGVQFHNTPQEIKFPEPHAVKILEIDAGEKHCMAISEMYELFTWGSNVQGATGHFSGDRDILRPRKLDLLEHLDGKFHRHVVGISGGGQHSLLLTQTFENDLVALLPGCITEVEMARDEDFHTRTEARMAKWESYSTEDQTIPEETAMMESSSITLSEYFSFPFGNFWQCSVCFCNQNPHSATICQSCSGPKPTEGAVAVRSGVFGIPPTISVSSITGSTGFAMSGTTMSNECESENFFEAPAPSNLPPIPASSITGSTGAAMSGATMSNECESENCSGFHAAGNSPTIPASTRSASAGVAMSGMDVSNEGASEFCSGIPAILPTTSAPLLAPSVFTSTDF
jgi:Regulator of chromosome condensation (RCC1) repeat